MSLRLMDIFRKLHITQKRITIFGVVMQMCSIVLLFIPGMYDKYVTIIGAKDPIKEICSFMYLFGETKFDVHISIILLVLFLCFMFVNTMLMLVSFFKKNKWCNSKWLIILPTINLALILSFSLWADKNMVNIFFLEDVMITTSVDMGILFYTECFLLFLVLINDICKKFLSLPETITSTKKIRNSVQSEIEMYKNLLDKELITLEEFDAKKKELLGI